MDPATGAVLAAVGCPDFAERQLNLAVQGANQPSSAFKPIILDSRFVTDDYSLESEFDAPVTIERCSCREVGQWLPSPFLPSSVFVRRPTTAGTDEKGRQQEGAPVAQKRAKRAQGPKSGR